MRSHRLTILTAWALIPLMAAGAFAADIEAGSFGNVENASDSAYYADDCAPDWASALLQTCDLTNAADLAAKLRAGADPLSGYLRTRLSPSTVEALDGYALPALPSDELKSALAADLNRVIQGTSIFTQERFAHVTLSRETSELVAQNPTGKPLLGLNRALLQEGYPGDIAPARTSDQRQPAASAAALADGLYDPDIGSVILWGNDDGSTAITLPFSVSVYGTSYTSLWINNNGNVTFMGALSAYTAFAFPNNWGEVIVAPFFADVDTRPTASGKVHYKASEDRVVVTWNGVGYFGNHTDKLNTFQLILTRDGLFGFSYATMQWTTGDSSGGSGGFGGQVARGGFDSGDGTHALVFWEGNSAASLTTLANKTIWYTNSGGNPYPNEPPVAKAGADQIVEQVTPDGTTVTLDGSASTDDGLIRALTFDWTEAGTSLGTGAILQHMFPWGEHVVTLSVNDGQYTTTDTVTIIVQDTTPPETFISAGPAENAFVAVRDVTFQWSGSDNATATADLVYSYAMDGSPASSFAPETTYTFLSLPDGPHILTVQARDLRGLVDPTPVVRHFTVDATFPMVSGISAIVSGLQCRIDWTTDEPATSQVDYGFTDVYGTTTTLDTRYLTSHRVDLSGLESDRTYHFRVRSKDRAGNETISPDQTFATSPVPDLVVTDITAPASASEGDTVLISWTVQNQGTAAVIGSWSDSVYLSDDHVVGSDTLLQVFSFSAALNPGETYTKTEQVTLPLGRFGNKYIVVQTDSGGDVSEGDHENNNVAIDDAAINILAPDLVVESMACPQTAALGQVVTVGLTVRNAGQGAARGSWTDTIYISPDNVLDASDTILAVHAAPAGGLAPGGTYTADVSVTIPSSLPPAPTPYYIFARTDSQNGQTESNENNNIGEPCEVQVLAPDLAVTSVTPPSEGWTGQRVDVRWTVVNQAVGVSAAGVWNDCVYLSTDAVAGDDILLGCLPRPVELNGGEHYDRAGSFTIPAVADGDYWIIVKADHDNAIPESDEADNAKAAGPFPIHVTPCADLVANNLVVYTEETVSGGAVALDWVVSNVGIGPTNVPRWNDGVYLSSDQTPGGDDQRISVVAPNPTALNPTEGYPQSVQCITPAGLFGTFYIIVKADADNALQECDEDNNYVVSATQLRIAPPTTKPACLTAFDVTLTPPNPQPGSSVTVNWRLKNTGDVATGPFYIDHGVVFSEDEALDPSGDTRLRFHTASISGNLAPGETTRLLSTTVTLPNFLWGDRYVFVWPDPQQRKKIDRAPGRATISIPPPLPCDLEVDMVTAPAAAFSGQPITIHWRVRNAANQLTHVDSWQDAVILSRDDSLATTEDNLQIGQFTHTGALDFDQFYDASQTIVLPGDASGTYYVFVLTDSQDEAYEMPDGEGNNSRRAPDPAMIVTYAPPDLQVQELTIAAGGAPVTSIASGSTVVVNWTVFNAGTGATSPGSWSDKVYISADATLDSSDIVLATVERAAPLNAGATYPASASVLIPLTFQGSSVYVFVCTDSESQSYESDDANNCRASDAFEVTCGAGDLSISSLTVTADGSPPLSVLSGTTLTVNYTVTNTGPGPSAVPSWPDRICISADNTLDGNDPVLDTVVHTGTLNPGQAYTVGRNVTIPVEFSAGEAFIFICADSGNVVFECDETNNCRSNQPAFTVQPGTAELVVPNVAVLQGDVPVSSVQSGGTVTVRWTVRNEGPGGTVAGRWSDRIHVSTDATLDSTDPVVGTATHSDALAAQAETTLEQQVQIPIGIAGQEVFVFVSTDVDGLVYESNNDNNFGQSSAFEVIWGPADLMVESVVAAHGTPRGQVINLSWTVRNLGGLTSANNWSERVYLSADRWLSGDDVELPAPAPHSGALGYDLTYVRTESFSLPPGSTGFLIVQTNPAGEVLESNTANNVASVALPSLDCDSDLVVSVDAPATAYSGQLVTVRWTVTNQGGQATNSSSWRDVVYLSPDQYLDRDMDIYLGYVEHTGALAGGTAYDQPAVLEARIPLGVTGALYAFIVADAHGGVCETNEDNNTGVDGYAIKVVLPPPADLVVSDIVVPASGTLAEPFTVQWTVHNNSTTNAALGEWHDAVYLSADAAWSLDDVKVGTVAHTGPLAVGAGYTAELTAPLPGVPIGNYHVLVRTDVYNEVRETATGETNNMTASAGTIAVQAVDLALGTPYPGTLGAGESRYFRIAIPADRTLRVTLDSAAVEGANELYIRQGAVPDRGRFDVAFKVPFAPDQQVVVPDTGGGDYYVLLYCDKMTAPADYTLLAESIPFGIDLVSPARIGDEGQVTVTVQGARFKEGAEVQLIQGSTVLYAAKVKLLDATTAKARFMMSAAPHGLYDLMLTNPDGGSAVATRAVTVETSTGMQVELTMIGNLMVRKGGMFLPTGTLVNTGNVDAPYVTISMHFDMAHAGQVSPSRVGVPTADEMAAEPGSGDTVHVGWWRPMDSLPLQNVEPNVDWLANSPTAFSEGRFTTDSFMVRDFEPGRQLTFGARIISSQASSFTTRFFARTETRVGYIGRLSEAFESDRRIIIEEADLSVAPAELRTLIGDPYGWQRLWFTQLILAEVVDLDDILSLDDMLRIEANIANVTSEKSLSLFKELSPSESTKDKDCEFEKKYEYRVCLERNKEGYWKCIKGWLGAIHNALACSECLAEATVPAISWGRIVISCSSCLKDLHCIRISPAERCHEIAERARIKCEGHGCWAECTEGAIRVDGFQVCKIYCIDPGYSPNHSFGRESSASNANEGGSCGGAGAKGCGGIVRPIDPNEKNGPSGYGDRRFVGVQEQMPYTIYFENLPTATAWATKVTITDQLSPDLDWRTFQLGEIAFGDTLAVVPDRRHYHYGEVTLASGLVARLQAELDTTTGLATWTLTAIDPETGEPPTDPALGLLPPNNPETHDGEGHVTFFIRPKAATPTGTEVRNKAMIVFDINEPIETNEVFNTVDSGIPQSAVAALPAVSPSTSIPLTWSGDDPADGSGLSGFTVYVSTDGGTYVPFVNGTTETSAVFNGEFGRSYRFYSVARDNAGNVEPAPPVPDATTTTPPPPDTTPPTLISAVSRKTHGTAGEIDMPLSLAPAAPGIECRTGGPTKVILTFSEPIRAADDTPDANEVGLSGGTLVSAEIDGSQMILALAGVPDPSCLTITLTGITDLAGNVLAENAGARILVLVGDANWSKSVNGQDLLAVKAHIGQAVGATNARYDVNCNGLINVQDMLAVRVKIGNGAPPCP